MELDFGLVEIEQNFWILGSTNDKEINERIFVTTEDYLLGILVHIIIIQSKLDRKRQICWLLNVIVISL